MKGIIPKKLQPGDEIRVIAPSSSLVRVGGIAGNQKAVETLIKMGFKITFSEHCEENDMLSSSTIASRVADIHEAFRDEQVKGILTAIGGFNSNELLPYLDFDLIRSHPKIICGFSDITALNNAITAKTGLVTYIGPHFSSFKMEALQDYQSKMFLHVLSETGEKKLTASSEWSSDSWFLPDAPRNLQSNEWQVYHEGVATGVSLVGNLGTFALLQGTVFQPDLTNSVLFVESSEDNDVHDFDRNLASLLQVCPNPKAVLVGRFPKEVGMTKALLLYILDKYPILKEIPVMYEVNFGHAQPIFTFPIGQEVTVDTTEKSISFTDEER